MGSVRGIIEISISMCQGNELIPNKPHDQLCPWTSRMAINCAVLAPV